MIPGCIFIEKDFGAVVTNKSSFHNQGCLSSNGYQQMDMIS